MATYAEQLASVQATIARIEGGVQSYAQGDRSATEATLRDLYDREKWLRKMADRENRGGIRVQYGLSEN